MSPVQLPLRPSPWVETFCFFCFLEVFATLTQKCTKTYGKTKKTKKKFHPMSPVQLPLRPSPWVETFCFFLFFWFSRGCCNCVSPNNISCSFFVFFVFLFLGFLGEILTLTNIHWHSFHPSTFYIDVFIELLILATEPSEKMHGKNSSTLSPTSSGTPLD